MTLSVVCFRIVQTSHGKILYYFHGPYKHAGKAWIVTKLMSRVGEEHRKFIEEWTRREVLKTDIPVEELQGLIGRNAVVDYEKNTILCIHPVPETEQRRLYIRPNIVVPRALRPEALDPTPREQDIKQKKFEKEFLGRSLES